ncbi:MAG: hypothetical protein KDD15_04725, partial [Lewinella sp.]|nr:hypothetical protein [Lewinella sp.]
MRRIIWLVLLFVGWSGPMWAQERDGDILIEKNYNGLAFAEFAEKLQQDYDIQCYYFSGWIGALKISQSATPSRLSNILTESLAGTDYHFFIHPNGQLILTLGVDIRSTLQLKEPGDDTDDIPSVGRSGTGG